MILVNNRPILVNSRPLIISDGPAPGPTVPNDMDFLYFAKDFDGSKITNSAPNSEFGDYIKQGTLTLHGSDASAYLTNGLTASNYLYKDLTTAQLDSMKAIDSTYTFFIRVMQNENGTGGIISWRNGNSYIYMIRCFQKQLQLHTTQGYNCGSDFMLDIDRVYKVVVNGSSFKAYNLDNSAEYSLTYSTNRTMTSRMTTFNADLGSYSEARLTKFYALAGIPRATTAEEDEIIKQCMMNQSTTI